jgi:hypothetical protein
VSDDVNLVASDLREDADWWDRISVAMNGALTIMRDDCALPYATFDGISHLLGADRRYAATLDQLTTLLDGGVTETASIATRLRATATTMAGADQAAADGQSH